MHISDNLYTNGYEYYLKDRGLNRIVSAKKDGSLQPSWDTGEPHTPWVTTIEKSLKAGKPMPYDDDDVEQRVINAFLKGDGLEDVTINGKVYQGLLFDENSQQSKNLKESSIFDTYFNDYLSCMNNEIRKCIDNGEINIENISKNLETMLKKPNFSDWGTILSDDFYALMGGTQNIEIKIEITPISDGEYKLNTTMYINDWYGADSDDINKKIDYKNIGITTAYAMTNPTDFANVENYKKNMKNIRSNFKSLIPGLEEFFYLQHRYGCKPFPTQIIYKSRDSIKLDK